MRKALVVVLALMGLPLGLEAQTEEDLINEVLAARQCQRLDGELRCTFTLGDNLRFTTLQNGDSETEPSALEMMYQRDGGNFFIGAAFNSHGESRGFQCFLLGTTPNYRKYGGEIIRVLISPRTGNVYSTSSVEEYDRCNRDR